MTDGTIMRNPEWNRRLEGLVPLLPEIKVVIVGCGSVGSYVAEALVRAGVMRLVLIDPDRVEITNLTRTTYTQKDIGDYKTDALNRRLVEIFPDLDLKVVSTKVEMTNLTELLADAHLVVSAVDSRAASARINRVAYGLRKSSEQTSPIVVHVGLYRGAEGGEVITTIPGITPCWMCSTGGVRNACESSGVESVDRVEDYGNGRLNGEIALGADIHHCASAATKIILSLLTFGGDETRLTNFMAGALTRGANYLMLGMTPSYHLFHRILIDAPAQYAFQSIWLTTQSHSSCPFCSEKAN